jgi:TonB family protein
MATVASHSDIAQFVPDYSTQFLGELQGILEKAQRFSGASGVAIAFVEGTELVTKSGLGASAPEVGSRSPIQGSFTGLSVQTREVQRCDDASCDSRVDSHACASLGISSMVIVPIAEKNKVFGVLAGFASKPNAFSPTHVALLRTLADIVVELYNRYPAERPLAASAPDVTLPTAKPSIQQPDAPKPAPPAQIAHTAIPVATSAIKNTVLAASKLESAPKGQSVDAPNPKAPVLPPTPIRLTEAPVIVPPPKPELKVQAKVEVKPAPAKSEPLRIERKVDSPRYAAVVDIDAARERREDVLSSAADIGPSFVTKGAAEAPIFSSYSAIGALEQHQREESGSKRVLMIAAALVVVVVLVVSGYLFSHRSSETAGVVAQPVQQAPVAANPAPTTVPNEIAPPTSNTVASAVPVEKTHERVAETVKSPAREKTPEQPSRKPEPAPLLVANSGAIPKRTIENVDAPTVIATGSADASGILGMVKTAQPKAAFRASSVTPPELTRRIAPIYPSFARQFHLKSERVVLNATIAKDGSVSEVNLVRGKQMFVDAAITAVRQWKYKPAYLNGDPVPASIEIALDFTN